MLNEEKEKHSDNTNDDELSNNEVSHLEETLNQDSLSTEEVEEIREVQDKMENEDHEDDIVSTMTETDGTEVEKEILINEDPNQHTRKKVIAGNWKMYKTIEESVAYVKELLPQIDDKTFSELLLAVPFTAIKAVSEAASGSILAIGAQNMNDAAEGAFTGEIAATMLLEAGATFVILGHSERRRIFHEDNEFINKKVKRAITDGLRVILCVGESQEEHDDGNTEEVLEFQLQNCLKDIDLTNADSIMIAYEPVWAIGSGRIPTYEEIDNTHAFIRQTLIRLFVESQTVASNIKILYGGSVKPENASQLIMQKEIDGLLVGGASLNADSFAAIINNMADFFK